jgi:hypothetical protein
MPETQVVQIRCPKCGTPYQAPVRTVIDVGQEPRLREAFLAGQVNVAICPNCKGAGLIEVPLVYHDPEQEFLAVYFPQQVQIPEMERQRKIGEMTQELMRSLPPDQRKGYFLSPRQFLNRQNLLDAILGTLGVSQEELDRQRKKLKLMEQLVVMADDRKGLEMMIKGQDANLDYEFFILLSGRMERTEALGEAKAAERLKMLRDNLLDLTTFGKRAARQRAAVESLQDVKSPDELVAKFIAVEQDEATAMAVSARPLLDYTFFQKLTERIDASQGAERDRLTRLRDHLLTLTQQMDQATRARMDEAMTLLKEILQSPNPRSTVREHAEEIDDVFMGILSLNMQEAEKKGAREAMQRLAMVYTEIMAISEEGLPPEVRLINDLLRAPYPDGTRNLLQQRRSEMTPEVIALMDRMAQEMEGRDVAEQVETGKRLRDIKTQAMLLV